MVGEYPFGLDETGWNVLCEFMRSDLAAAEAGGYTRIVLTTKFAETCQRAGMDKDQITRALQRQRIEWGWDDYRCPKCKGVCERRDTKGMTGIAPKTGWTCPRCGWQGFEVCLDGIWVPAEEFDDK